jgi:predicted 3-demethylubiquinone-9 3-methyltransferase (glyoxalase superfamily)
MGENLYPTTKIEKCLFKSQEKVGRAMETMFPMKKIDIEKLH